MSTVETNLATTRESARLTRFEPGATILATNVQKAIEAIVSLAAITEPKIVTTASDTVSDSDAVVAVIRASPTATTLQLGAVAGRNRVPVRIFDLSTGVSAHTITITPAVGETIMGLSSWPLFSNPASLAGVTLFPSTTLGGWYIAP